MLTCRSVHTLRGLRGPRSVTREINKRLRTALQNDLVFHILHSPGLDESPVTAIPAIVAKEVVAQTLDTTEANSLHAI